ncbi:MAG: DNA translocase FtsK [Treponema sp.]|nr:DNA translocase FtsK [Treponema sp.]
MGLFFGFSICAALFNTGNIIGIPGALFVRSYGFLALMIPGYLLYAALLLADPVYRPQRIFFLASLIVPFITAAIGFHWIREYQTLSLHSPFMSRAGRVGLGFFFFFLVSLEISIILLLKYLIFSPNSIKRGIVILQGLMRNRTSQGEALAGQPEDSFEEEDSPEEEGPSEDGDPADERPFASAMSLRDIYAQAAAAMSSEGETPIYQRDAEVTDTEAIVEEVLRELKEDYKEGKEDDPQGENLDSPKGNDSTLSQGSRAGMADDVERALAEAKAFAEEESARQEDKKDAVEKGLPKKKRNLPYFVPVEGLLTQYPDGEYWVVDDATREAAITLKETFKEFNIQVEVTGIRKGPVITMFEILPAPGIRLAKIENLADNIALRLAAQSVRIVAPIPGKHAVGIEVPNAKRNIVSFREIIEGELSKEGTKPEIPMILGKDITGEAVTVDLVQMPHLLIAGATGSGKSVCVNSMILSILYQKPPSECRLILIDPKIVELKLYNDIPHLLTPVITEPKKAFQALQYCIFEMERRYACLDSMGVRDIRSYNRRIKERNIAAETMPYIVVVVDEYADLMATTGKELESTVARLAAMSRAVGVHLVLATQRPSIDVITGLIKANIPSRIAFMVAGRMNSQIIIDTPGAEKLLGKGDMLYAGAVDPFPVRMQGAFVSEDEVERVVDYVKSLGEPDYIDEEMFYDEEEEEADPSLFSDGDDPLYDKALEIVLQQGKASASYIQRRLKIGYNRAARLVELMEHQGVVGPAQGSKPREVLRSFG